MWCDVPKALLPKGKGRNVYPWVQVNGSAVCVARALCVVCVCWSSLLCHCVVAAGPVRLVGLVRLPWLGPFVALPSLRAPPFGLRAVTLWAGRAALPTALRSGPVLGWHGVVWCGVVFCGVVWCGVVWCGVVWCGVVWCGVVWCGVLWCGVVWCSVVWCGVVFCGVVWYGVLWCGMVWCSVVWCAVVWCAVV